MQWEKDQFVRLPRSADAIAGTEDSALIGGNFTLYAEVWLGIKEYHIKHAVPPPTSSGSRTSDIMVQRNLIGQTFKPGCKTGESLKTVCSMHADCGYYSHHVFAARGEQRWICKGWAPHTKDCSKVTKTKSNEHKMLKKAAQEAEAVEGDAAKAWKKHKTHKNKVSMDEAARLSKAMAKELPDSDDSDCIILDNLPKCHTSYITPADAAQLVVHLYRIGTVPSVKSVRNELFNHVPGVLDDDYLQRVKTAAAKLYQAREMQSLQMMPRVIEALRKKGHSVKMDAKPLEEMKVDVAGCLNTEWKRRQMFDSTLPDCELTPDDVMELDQLDNDMCPIVYNGYWSLGINRRHRIAQAPKLEEPNSGVHKCADACHIKASGTKSDSQLGVFYLVVEPDADRRNRTQVMEYRGANEQFNPGWDQTFGVSVAMEPSIVHNALLSSSTDASVIKACAVMKVDGDKGLREAAKKHNIDIFHCTNHSSENVKKHASASADIQGERWRAVCRQPNQAKSDALRAQLLPAIQAYTDKQYPRETSSVAYHPSLQSGGNIGHDTSQNAAESTNNTIEKVRNATTGLEALLAAFELASIQFFSTREEIKKWKEHLPERVQGILAVSRHRNKQYGKGDLKWIGNIPGQMSAEVKSRKHVGQHETCHLLRVKDHPNGRVLINCTCDYVKMEGFCDHAVLICDRGEKAHVHELMPYNSTTAAWRAQYHLDEDGNDTCDVSFMQPPTHQEIMACDGETVWAEMGFKSSCQLMPLKAVGRC